jgi:hypothetical protein
VRFVPLNLHQYSVDVTVVCAKLSLLPLLLPVFL